MHFLQRLAYHKEGPLAQLNLRNDQEYTARELALHQNKLGILRYFAQHSDIKQKFGFSNEKKSYPELIWLLLAKQSQSVQNAETIIDPKLVLFTLFRLSGTAYTSSRRYSAGSTIAT